VVTGELAIADDGVLADPQQSSSLTDPRPLGDMLEQHDDLLGGEAGVEQGSPLAFGEAVVAGFAVPDATPMRAVVVAHGKVTGTPLARVGAVG